MLVALANLILPTLTTGPSLMLKFTCTEAGGIVLTSVLMVANWWPCSASNCLIDGFGALDLGRVVLALDREADLLLFEAVQNVGYRDRAQTLVVDLADIRFLADENVEDDALFGVFTLDAQIVEVAGVPERVESRARSRWDRRCRRRG